MSRSSNSTLDQLRPGATARVKGCHGRGAIYQRLCEMGLIQGAELRVVRRIPLGGPLEVQIQNYHLSLRRSEARMVLVDP